jgi:hypothetical protein
MGMKEITMDFPPTGPYGVMVSFQTWVKYIRLSKGSRAMKTCVIDHIRKNVYTGNGMLDSFKLGWALGSFSNTLKTQKDTKDFLLTIKLTRNTDNVPIIKEMSPEEQEYLEVLKSLKMLKLSLDKF